MLLKFLAMMCGEPTARTPLTQADFERILTQPRGACAGLAVAFCYTLLLAG